MRAFFDARQRAHAPVRELHNGGYMPYAESPARLDALLSAVAAEPAVDHGEAPILAVHDAEYLRFLQDAPRLWAEAGREGDVTGYVWPVVGRRSLKLNRIDALVGQYSFDASTPLTPASYAASYGSAHAALTALDAVLAGERAAFAACRPPGHHAGRDYCGGYCHINAAAVTAQAARDAGHARVAVLDIDYHHGNGTQDIFLERADVFYASVHADPATDYPFFWGHCDERGTGAGEGTTLNLPLPQGTEFDAFRHAQAEALEAIARFAPGLLVVSFGADTWEGDPISRFRLMTEHYATLASDIAGCGWPTVVVMEGGYAIDALGRNVASFLSGF